VKRCQIPETPARNQQAYNFAHHVPILSLMDHHVPASEIEQLALGRLSAAKSASISQHLFSCGRCLYRLVALEVELATLEGMRSHHARPPDKRKPLAFVHDTGDGMIYSWLERRGKKWLARQWGDQLEGGRECSSMSEANDFLCTTFHEMFPEHRCTPHCCVDPSRARQLVSQSDAKMCL
jgi:hypothetical protein